MSSSEKPTDQDLGQLIDQALERFMFLYPQGWISPEVIIRVEDGKRWVRVQFDGGLQAVEVVAASSREALKAVLQELNKRIARRKKRLEAELRRLDSSLGVQGSV